MMMMMMMVMLLLLLLLLIDATTLEHRAYRSHKICHINPSISPATRMNAIDVHKHTQIIYEIISLCEICTTCKRSFETYRSWN